MEKMNKSKGLKNIQDLYSKDLNLSKISEVNANEEFTKGFSQRKGRFTPSRLNVAFVAKTKSKIKPSEPLKSKDRVHMLHDLRESEFEDDSLDVTNISSYTMFADNFDGLGNFEKQSLSLGFEDFSASKDIKDVKYWELSKRKQRG